MRRPDFAMVCGFPNPARAVPAQPPAKRRRIAIVILAGANAVMDELGATPLLLLGYFEGEAEAGQVVAGMVGDVGQLRDLKILRLLLLATVDRRI
jgi:hypothetical protein